MNCEQCLAYLETGSLLQRMLARRHANYCAACEREIEKLVQIKRDLTASEPLSTHQRRLWERAAIQVPSYSTSRWSVWQLSLARAAAVATCLLVMSFFFWTTRPLPDKPHVEVAQVVLNPELDRLNGQLDTLEAEIAQLSKDAALNDVHQQVLAVIDTYKRW